ncbi:MAG: pyruvate dehydrogenase [Verrucomicrobiales bacterium]|nr:pyruvate dehydrogenase [Verrucomicrobiales bacterium]|tara:strand:+ start:55323 stop:56276 length:954 start_codon:yes stop_codon:yes gene_type:complete
MTTYCEAILEAHRWLMREQPKVFCIGQGLWSPWYVGNSMRDLEKEFGVERVIDTPVSEAATTGAALGAALGGYRPIVVHPRVDFAVLAMDAVVNQAANWNHIFGGGIPVPLTVRAIINRGGEQGAQHSQALHAWYAHVPGLRVVMPSTAADARDLLVASVLCDDPVVYIDDRWLYEEAADLDAVDPIDLRSMRPRVQQKGTDLTLVGTGYGAAVCRAAAAAMDESCEVIDVPVINPMLDADWAVLRESYGRTGRMLVVDAAWGNCGWAATVVAGVGGGRALTLPASPAPTSGGMEEAYYRAVGVESVVAVAQEMCGE